ncbi:XdhC/CoxI family protein [Aquimarina sp. BL5]|uniref:XdhC family protein n=1 Tax=Aquimarina sp. BL5 TaxID=1714860 RepID=UPI000E4F857A|nr:XdhC/CoxI family protein [Aquimarina sp. BL5]AXT53397.1 XdhC/CoxI family protein [Aquimarina sp. BL5]RKN08899.1 XdhC/CoxI family protein [Aquimarina sp. BL5]
MEFWQHLLSKLQDTQNVYLLTVIENIGSSPGRRGFKMLVAEDGFIFGSIGGGVMEFSLVEEAKKLLQTGDLKIFLKKQVHQGHKQNGSGMICSGEQTVVFHPLNIAHVPVVEAILDCLRNNGKGTFVVTPTSINFSKDQLANAFEYKIASSLDWFFKEHIGYRSTLYIVGGGHLSVAVSELFVTLGFYVVVFDNREQLNTLELNTSAHQKLILDFNEIANYIPEGPDNYVAIMTNRYTDDKLVLSKLIRKNFAYIGVLGSTAKLKTMWEVLQKEGITISQLNEIHAPIGLAIKSQTPNEIAVSIAAQVIKIKNVNQ